MIFFESPLDVVECLWAEEIGNYEINGLRSIITFLIFISGYKVIQVTYSSISFDIPKEDKTLIDALIRTDWNSINPDLPRNFHEKIKEELRVRLLAQGINNK